MMPQVKASPQTQVVGITKIAWKCRCGCGYEEPFTFNQPPNPARRVCPRPKCNNRGWEAVNKLIAAVRRLTTFQLLFTIRGNKGPEVGFTDLKVTAECASCKRHIPIDFLNPVLPSSLSECPNCSQPNQVHVTSFVGMDRRHNGFMDLRNLLQAGKGVVTTQHVAVIAKVLS